MRTYREVIEKVAELLKANEMEDYGVQSPGKFEGESIAAIYAYDAEPDDIEFSEIAEEIESRDDYDEFEFPAHPREIEFEPHEQAILRVKRFGYLTESDSGFVTLHEFAKRQKVCYFIDGAGCLTSEFRPVEPSDY